MVVDLIGFIISVTSCSCCSIDIILASSKKSILSLSYSNHTPASLNDGNIQNNSHSSPFTYCSAIPSGVLWHHHFRSA